MRKKLLALAVITLAISMTGCTGNESQEKETVTFKTVKESYKYIEYRDVETGVHYFYTYGGGITVRVNADGTPYTSTSKEE